MSSNRRKLRGAPRAIAAAVMAASLLTPLGSAQAATTGVLARPADELVGSIGVNTHLHYGGGPYMELANVKRVLVDAGIRNIRDYPVNTTALSELGKEGIKLSAVIAHPDQGSWAQPIDYYFTNIKKLPSMVATIEGTNEPDITMGSDWATKVRSLQRDIWQRTKADPALAHVKVAGPSITWERNAPALGDISAYADYGNVHPYPGGRMPETRVGADVAASKANNVAGKPVIATESGYHTALSSTSGHRAASEAAQGVYTPRLFLQYFNIGVPRTFAYELVDQGADQTQSEKTFGLVRRDFSPKPAYTATKNLIELLEDPGSSFTPGRLDYELGGGDAATRQVLLQKRDGSFWLAVWQETSVWDEVNKRVLDPADRTVTLQLGARADVRTYAPNTGTAARSSETGTTSLSFSSSERVTLVEIRPAATATVPTPTTTSTTVAPAPTTTVAPTPATTSTTVAPAPTTTTTLAPAPTNLLAATSAVLDPAAGTGDTLWIRRSSGATTSAPVLTTSASEVLAGTKSLKQTKNSTTTSNWDAWQTNLTKGIAVKAGTTYTFRGDYRLPDAASGIRNIIEWADSSGRGLGASTGTTTTVGRTGTTTVTATGTAPAGATKARLITRVTTMAGGHRILADQLSLTAG